MINTCVDCQELFIECDELNDTKEFFRKQYLVVCEDRDNLKKELEYLKEEHFHLRIHYKHLLKERGE